MLSLLCIRKFESWFSVYLEKSASLSTPGPNYSTAVTWSSADVLGQTYVLRCSTIFSMLYSLTSDCSTHLYGFPALEAFEIMSSDIHNIFFSWGRKMGQREVTHVRKVCLCVALLREFWSPLYSYVCPDYGGRFNIFYWKSFLCSEWMLANYHQLVLHTLYYTPKYLPSINILGCYVILGLLVRVRESSGKIGKGMKKLLRPCLLTRKMKPEVIVHFRWLHWLGQQIFL